MKGIFHLSGTLKNYDWGGFSFLPSLLNIGNEKQVPFAELWIGTHPAGASRILAAGTETPLSDHAGQLPFLFKILDVREMLSIQVHPSIDGAREGFAEENRAGLKPDDTRRNYRDENDKPELMVALGEFWLLHGFKPTEELHDVLVNVTELNELLPVFHGKGLEGLYRHVMEAPQEAVNRLLGPLHEKLLLAEATGELSPDSEDYWAARAFDRYTRGKDYDRGIFSIYFFNLVQLKKGEGIFQAPGVPHAYLRGQNVEIMGNSDNVLRGGLTNKPIAIAELMKHLRFDSTYPQVILPVSGSVGKEYPAPTDRFHLSVLDLVPGSTFRYYAETDEILLLTEGEGTVSTPDNILSLARGKPALLITGGQEISFGTVKGATIFRARS